MDQANNQEASPVASHSSAVGNSIEQNRGNLLVYKTIANNDDSIRLSCLFIINKGKYAMPSLSVLNGETEVFSADNDCWIIETFYPAIIRFKDRRMVGGDKATLAEFIDCFKTIYEQIEAIDDVFQILQYAFDIKMLNGVQDVQVSDTTEDQSSTKAD